MRRPVLLSSLILLIASVATTPSNPTSATQSFKLPHSKAVDSNKPITCSAIASASLTVNAEQRSNVNGSVQAARQKLSLHAEDDTLYLLVSPAEKNGIAIADHYRITNNGPGWLAATVLHSDEMPRGYSIALNKQNGFAVWAHIEPKHFPDSEFPYGETVYLTCRN